MITIYKYSDFFEFINISIIISVPFISLMLYRNSKNKSLLIAFLICTIELFLINLLYEYGYKYPHFLSIILNIIIIKSTIINHIKKINIALKKDKARLKTNKKNISKISNNIEVENILQDEYKNEVLYLEKKIRKIIYESDEPIFIINDKLEFLFANDSFKNLVRNDKYIYDNLNIFSYLDYKFIYSEEIKECIKNSKNNKDSINLKTYDDKIYRFSCIEDIDNETYIKICILNDITESTLIQNQLKISEERYKKLMDILNDGVIIHDLKNITYINDKAIEIFNLDRKTKNLSICDIKEKVIDRFRKKLLDNMTLVKWEKKEKVIDKIEMLDGKVVEFITTNVLINNEEMLLSIAIDITNIENAVTELEQSEKTYKLLLQTLPEGIIIIDKKTKNYIYRNEAMIKILKDIGVDKLNELIKDYTKKYSCGKFKKFTLNMEDKKNISLAIIDIKEEGTLMVVVRVIEDQYKVEKMEEKLNEINYKNKFKNEFLVNLTNDIRKPVNTIFSVNNILSINQDKYNSDYINNYNKLVKQNCNRLTRLLNNIEEINNIDNGIYDMNLNKCDIVCLVKDIAEKSKSYTDEKGIKLKFSSNIKEKYIVIDKDKIEKIILNLLSNSIKFTDKGGYISVEVSIKNEIVKIGVIDSGSGIPNDKLSIIFENFEQVDRSLSREAEGAGIGLSLVKKLSDLHNAKIEVKSKVGRGSAFYIILDEKNINELEFKELKECTNFSDNEKIDIEFSDIYFDVTS